MTGLPLGWQPSFSQRTKGTSPPKINPRTRLLDFSQITIRLRCSCRKRLIKPDCTTWATSALTHSGNELPGQRPRQMILAAALTLSFLAILGLIQLAHLFLFWLTPPASPRAADNIVDIQHAAGDLGSAVISQAKSGFGEFGQKCGFRIEVAAFCPDRRTFGCCARHC